MGFCLTEVAKRRLERSASAVFMCALLLVGIVLVFVGSSATAKQFATLRILGGQVEVQHASGAIEPGHGGEALREGDTVRTGADGLALIEFFEGSQTRIDNDTSFEFTELATIRDVALSKVIVGEQLQGKSYNHVVELTDPESRFEIVTPTVEASVTGSEFSVEVDAEGLTRILVFEGSVVATGSDGEVEVLEGTMVESEADGSVGEPVEIPEEVLDSEWIEFNQCELDDAPECQPEIPPEPTPPVGSEEPGDGDPGTPPEPTTGPDDGTTPGDGTGGTETPPAPPPPPPTDPSTPPPPPENHPPEALFGYAPTSGQAPLLVAFVDGSSDPDRDPLKREWNFGDGASASGVEEQHIYRDPGTYTVTLTVTDPHGASDSYSREVVVEPDTTPPNVTITSAPGDPSDSPDATFTFTTSETGSGFDCVLDGAAQGCGDGPSGSVSYTGLEEGPHLFSVSVTDAAGNTGSASHTWTIEIPPVLDHIVISPSDASIEVGGSLRYSAEAFDTDGGSMGDVTEETSFSIAPDGSCTGATCSASQLGEHTVTGTYQGLSDTAVLTVVPALDHIVISPAQATIKLGESQAYTAEAFDEDGDSLGDVTGDTSFSIDPSGSCSGETCSASVPGTFTVTGTYLGASDTAQLRIVEPPDVSLLLYAEPGLEKVGKPFSIKVVVMNGDGSGSQGSGCAISVSLGGNEEGATLSGNVGPTTANGSQLVFSPLSIDQPGSYTIVATSVDCSAQVTSGSFDVASETEVGVIAFVPLGALLSALVLALGRARERRHPTLPPPSDRDLGFGRR